MNLKDYMIYKATIIVAVENLPGVQLLVKKHNLRFTRNPLEVGLTALVCVEGKSADMNAFNREACQMIEIDEWRR